MTFRNAARKDSNSTIMFASWYTDRVLSCLFASVFILFSVVLVIVVFFHMFIQKRSIQQIHPSIKGFSYGMKQKRRKTVLAFYTWFVASRFLLALLISLTMIMNHIAQAALFLAIVVIGFVLAFFWFYESFWKHIVNWMLEFSLVLFAILTLIEEAKGKDDVIGKVFIMLYAIAQCIIVLIVIVGIIYDFTFKGILGIIVLVKYLKNKDKR